MCTRSYYFVCKFYSEYACRVQFSVLTKLPVDDPRGAKSVSGKSIS